MTKTIKESGITVKVLKQYRGQSNNYVNDTKIYADLYRVSDNNGKVSIVCSTELD